MTRKIHKDKVARLKEAVMKSASLGEKRKLQHCIAKLEKETASNPVTFHRLVACPHCKVSHWIERQGEGAFELCGTCKSKIDGSKELKDCQK